MKKSVSIVEARRELGRLAELVRRTRQPIALTRRGRVVARIAPEPLPSEESLDSFAALRGSLRLNCTFDELQAAVRSLRTELSGNLERRAVMTRAGRRASRG